MWFHQILLCVIVGHFETVHCHTIFYVCRHFVSSIYPYLRVELLPYIQSSLEACSLTVKRSAAIVVTHTCHSFASVHQEDLFTLSPFVLWKSETCLADVFSPPVYFESDDPILYWESWAGSRTGKAPPPPPQKNCFFITCTGSWMFPLEGWRPLLELGSLSPSLRFK